MHVYKGVRSCPTKTYYTLTHGKIMYSLIKINYICLCNRLIADSAIK